MWIRRLLTCGTAGILLAGLLVTPVSAHRHHCQTDSASKICSLCTLKGCTETGYHIHDGETYCGYDHSCGYCDGSCIQQNDCETPARSRGHHSGHHHRHHG